MASEKDHIALANRNQQLLDHLIGENSFPDWITTVAFYKAIHVVEAVFANHLSRHSTSHAHREETLSRFTAFEHIAKNFSHLLNESRNYRYLLAPPGRLTMEQVKSQLVYKRLHAVEQQSLPFLSAAGRADLDKVTPPADS
jgi:hypothetical protein